MASLAICAIFKNERAYLEEWVAYHHIVGADHFYLYDNGSSDGGAAKLNEGPLRDSVTIIPFPQRPAQMQAYQHFVENFSVNHDWAAVIDLDEFICPVNSSRITDLLPLYDGFSGVLLNWLNYGPNGHETCVDGLVIENYIRRVSENYGVNRHVKSLVRTSALKKDSIVASVHVLPLIGPVCNSAGVAVPNEPTQETACHEPLRINHYYTKSRQDWLQKMAKGRADKEISNVSAWPVGEDVLFGWFDEYTRNATIVDEVMLRFATQVKELLGKPTSKEVSVSKNIFEA